ncbi:hypothetical protein D3C71_1828330 [compost metagenome]
MIPPASRAFSLVYSRITSPSSSFPTALIIDTGKPYEAVLRARLRGAPPIFFSSPKTSKSTSPKLITLIFLLININWIFDIDIIE